MPADPRPVFEARLSDRRASVGALGRLDQRLSSGRGIAFSLAAVAAGFALADRVAWWPTALPALVFLGLVIVHERVARRRARAQRAVDHYERALARLDDRWMGAGPTASWAPAEHPYAEDLDLFGEASLFDRLCRAHTRPGRERLASWLLGAGNSDARRILDRQRRVEAMRDRVDLREDLDIIGAEVGSELGAGSLVSWANAPAPTRATLQAWAIARLASPPLAIAGAVAWSTGFGPWLLVGLGTLLGLLGRTTGEASAAVAGPLDRRVSELRLLSDIVDRIAREPSEELAELRRPLLDVGDRIRELARHFGFWEAQRNPIFGPIAFFLAWTPTFAWRVERWRAKHGPSIAGWIDALAEFEALASLGGYAFENPSDPMPEILEGPASIEGEALGHPLLPRSTCVTNPIALGPAGLAAHVVSGSNMSGKSTFLRTVGLNTVLALAGAPVRAARLSVSPMAIGTSLRVQDSLAANRSRFWAELERLRAIHGLVAVGPTLFLLDEIFAGTNSHDRRLGAEALLRSLLERGAIGMLTTHDLALAAAADTLAREEGARVSNVHFEDELREGELVFDYRVRPGVVERSNAVALMRAVGLDI